MGACRSAPAVLRPTGRAAWTSGGVERGAMTVQKSTRRRPPVAILQGDQSLGADRERRLVAWRSTFSRGESRGSAQPPGQVHTPSSRSRTSQIFGPCVRVGERPSRDRRRLGQPRGWRALGKASARTNGLPEPRRAAADQLPRAVAQRSLPIPQRPQVQALLRRLIPRLAGASPSTIAAPLPRHGAVAQLVTPSDRACSASVCAHSSAGRPNAVSEALCRTRTGDPFLTMEVTRRNSCAQPGTERGAEQRKFGQLHAPSSAAVAGCCDIAGRAQDAESWACQA
jgi:hypothetical protein